MEKTKINITDEVAIHISDMNKWFGNFHVLRDINLEVRRGERIVVCGPSGSGKSTLIRCINRLEEHQKGSIIVDGTELTTDLKNIDKIRSEVGMVFQHFNLFPHLTTLFLVSCIEIEQSQLFVVVHLKAGLGTYALVQGS